MFPKLLAATALLIVPAAATAQSVNHAELEQIFGEPVTTSVTGKPQRASEAAGSLVIITRADIKRSPADDVPSLLKAYAGIDVARWNAGQADVAVRGGMRAYNASLLVLVNGQQVYLDHYGMTNWSGLGVQLEEIQQIEVVKGPNSALFGFNAATGVVNIITVNPLHSPQATATVVAGTEGRMRASATAAVPIGNRVGVRLSGGYERADELDALTPDPLAFGAQSIRDAVGKEGSGEIYARLGDATEAVLSASLSDTTQETLTPIMIFVPQRYETSSLGARLSHDLGWGMLSARLYRNWLDVDFNVLSGGLFSRLISNRTTIASGDLVWRAGTAHTLRLGAEYRENELQEAGLGYPGATYYKVIAGSGMWEGQLSERLKMTLAGRVDHLDLGQEGPINQPTIFTAADFDRSFTEWSFNGALRLDLGAAGALRLAGGRGIQSPSLTNFGLRQVFIVPGRAPVPVVLSGDPHVDPAIVWSAELGYNRSLAGGATLDAAAFYTRTDDLISLPSLGSPLRATPPTYPFALGTSANIGRYESYGIEASVAGQVGAAWRWRLDYSWTESDEHVPGNANGVNRWPLSLERSTPRHKVGAQLSYEQGRWLATMLARYTSSTTHLLARLPASVFEVTVEDAVSLDAKLGFDVTPNLTLALAGENLTNADGVDLSPIPAERRLRASLQLRF